MGTNYYRVPTVSEMEERRLFLAKRVAEMDMNPHQIERGFTTIPTHDSDFSWEYDSPWTEFIDGTSVHLGKRSSGWKFCWNFHDNKYYSNKAELLAFINGGRIVDEYGEEWAVEAFLEMALNWDGITADREYFEKYERNLGGSWEKYVDLEIDGLRVSSSTQFS